ncbi:MAG: flagellar basal body-associated FliL family protein [Alphaproteobacteria bacterium]|nr:flagellar basal body-associated FliL family protein [Alphaproteobacteria bacterium]MDX5367931.1 flagellar basal body-associated FliL family protein [Alphaproteobacteria bacterium]MDX5462784.1 flagellar basal body-associated FliL family protein [Alphaproteobacteria bacterium]
MTDVTADRGDAPERRFAGLQRLTPGRRRLLLAALPVAWLALGALIGYGAGRIDAMHPDGAAGQGAPVAAAWDLPDLLVTLDGPADRPVYLRLAVSLELAGGGAQQRDAARLARLTDSFQAALRALRPADLSGAAGTQRVKDELGRRAAQVLGPGRVQGVLIRELLIQ